MNRKPKFRAFVCGEMLPVLTIDFVNNAFYVLPESELEGGNQIEVIGIEKLIQYTGLKDAKGKEIYEGDIVKQKGWVCVVEFINEGYKLKVINHKKGIRYHSFFNSMEWHGNQDKGVCVIGNIHQNTELLK